MTRTDLRNAVPYLAAIVIVVLSLVLWDSIKTCESVAGKDSIYCID